LPCGFGREKRLSAQAAGYIIGALSASRSDGNDDWLTAIHRGDFIDATAFLVRSDLGSLNSWRAYALSARPRLLPKASSFYALARLGTSATFSV
jgi:hypothetical protein